MKCNSCGNVVDSQNTTCPSCGSSLYPSSNFIIQEDDYFETRRKLYVLCIIFLLIIIAGGLYLLNPTSASLINNKTTNNNLPGRTIMIYMVGSNLETELGLGSRDLSGIEYDKIKENDMHVLLMAGGTKSWYNNYINPNSTCIYELTENGYEAVEDKGLISMGKSSTLSSFLEYSYNKYKTGKYDLIIWDHGGAVDGSSYDDLFREGFGKDNLKLDELNSALSSSPFNKNNKLETVLYRTCLNSTIETANAIKDYANYMIASEEVTLGLSYGASALAFLNEVKKETSYMDYGTSFIDDYQNIIHGYCSSYQTKYECAKITYSIIDLSEISNLNNSIDKYFGNVNKNLDANFVQVSKMRADSRQYASEMDVNYDMVDLKELIDNLSTLENNGSKEVIDSLNKVVKYNYTNDNISAGLSIYMPYNSKSYFVSTYNKTMMPNNYKTFISKFYNLKGTYKTKEMSLVGKSTIFTKDDAGNANVSIELTDEEIENYAAGKYIIFADMGDNLYKPVFASDDINIVGNQLKANIAGKMVQICDNETCYWLTVNETTKEDNVIILKATGVLSKYNSIDDYKIDAVEFLIQIDEENPNGKIISVNKILNNQDSLDIGTVRLNLQDYETLTIATQYYTITDDQGNYISDWQGNGVYKGYEFDVNNFRFERKDFNNDIRYVAVIGYIDVSGKVTWSNLLELQ